MDMFYRLYSEVEAMCRSPVLLTTSWFFRRQFKTTYGAPSSEESPFYTLYEGAKKFGNLGYQTMFLIAIYAGVIAFMIGLIHLFYSSKGQSREQAKQKLYRVIFLSIFTSGLIGIICLVYAVFDWK